MSALYLRDLGAKTRRGLEGRVRNGRSAAATHYGYNVERRLGPDGQQVTGERTINQNEAEVVRRVFDEFAAGKSPKQIAKGLNADVIPAPDGGAWGFSTILGNAIRRTGLLRNELYRGKMVWNRSRFTKHPETGKRISRINPESEWITQDVPHLRIVDDELWQAVAGRLKATSKRRAGGGARDAGPFRFWEQQRPRYLLSGLTRCGVCGGSFSMVGATALGCSTARNRGTCSNLKTFRRDRLEARVLAALQSKLMEPALFKVFCDTFVEELNRLRIEASTTMDAARAEIVRIDRRLNALTEALMDGTMPKEMIREKSYALYARKQELEKTLAEAVEPPPLLHPRWRTITASRWRSCTRLSPTPPSHRGCERPRQFAR